MPERSYLLPIYDPLPMVFDGANGSWLFSKGRRFLDFHSGYGVNALGYNNPALVRSLVSAAQKPWHLSNSYIIPEQVELAKKLCEDCFGDYACFTNSGSEAMELAIKLARRYHCSRGEADRFEILSLGGAYHGRSYGVLSASDDEVGRAGFGPYTDGFRTVPFHDVCSMSSAVTEKTAAILLEPIQGHAGCRAIGAEELDSISNLCREKGALLVLDEIQTGASRTGRFFAFEWANIMPDIVAIGKSIAGGLPCGVTLCTKEIGDCMSAGSHASTFGGNPLTMSVALTAYELLNNSELQTSVQRLGARLRVGLCSLVAKRPDVAEEARGVGLLQGLKLRLNARRVRLLLCEQGLMVGVARGDVLRLMPPLIVSDEEMDLGLELMDRCFAAI